MSIRRAILDHVAYDPEQPEFHPHAGLWFDKYLKQQAEKTLEPYAQHVELVGEIIESTVKTPEPTVYQEFFSRWKKELKKMDALTSVVGVTGRLASGLGGASVIENGMTLHHTYGIPIIPGSSLKGTARAYAVANLAEPWDEKGLAFRTLFGGQAIPPGEKSEAKARVGIVVFYDALPIPGSFTIHKEVMTVHHSGYYQTGEKPPADWDSPTPIPFPSVRGQFLIALHAPHAPEWAVHGMEILKMALAERGVGGKTSSGYGRLGLSEDDTTSMASSETATQPAIPPRGYERGRVKEFGLGPNRSFGYIVPDRGGKDVFVHRSQLSADMVTLEEGQYVYYRRVHDSKGIHAEDVQLAE